VKLVRVQHDSRTAKVVTERSNVQRERLPATNWEPHLHWTVCAFARLVSPRLFRPPVTPESNRVTKQTRSKQLVSNFRQVLKALTGKRNDWWPSGFLATGRPTLRLPSIGVAIAVASIVIGWWAFSGATGVDDHSRQTFDARPALFAGAVSVMAMTWSHLLSTRLRPLEFLFGGLDRMYRWHRWSGALAVATVFLHTQIVDDVKGIPGASRSIAKAAEELAGIAETFLYILVIASFIRWVPYRWWRHTHKLMYPAYIISCIHFYTSEKPFGNGEAWGRFYSTAMIIGIAAGAHRLVWRDMIKRGRPYIVSSVNRGSRFLDLTLSPVGKPIKHQAGQFAFIKLAKSGLTEPHPFTIASGPSSKSLRFVMRTDGDWTRRVNEQLVVGDEVIVEGAFGRSHPIPRNAEAPVLWVAGGVGITPFLAAIDLLFEDPRPLPPHLFYSVSSREEAIGLDEFQRAHEGGLIQLHLHVTSDGSRLSPDDVTREFGEGGLVGAHVVMCGPHGLLRSISTAARDCGASTIHVEEFDIRSGIAPDLTQEVDDIIGEVATRLRARKENQSATQ